MVTTPGDEPPHYAIDDGPEPDELARRRQQRGRDLPTHDHDAERGLIGAVLLAPHDERTQILAAATTHDFTLPRNRTIWAALEALADHDGPLNPATIANELGTDLDAAGGHQTLRDLYADASTLGWHAWAHILRGHTRHRQATHALADIATDIAYGRDWSGSAQQLERIRTATLTTPEPSLDLDDFLNVAEPEYDWIVPNLIERGDRVILTGHEGHGKSTLLRQIAIQVAAGIHPFRGHPIEPQHVLLFDVENSAGQVRRKIRPLRQTAGHDLGRGMLRIECRPQGVDLLNHADRQYVTDLIAANKPDLLITGPLYKLAGGDPKDEESAKAISAFFDQIRVQHGCALILEAHQPHASGQATKRTIRPYGASLWMRWPEFGLHLADGGQIQHFRGDRDERDWPVALKRGGDWPWTPVSDPKALTFAKLMAHCAEVGYVPTHRDLALELETSQATITRSIQANQAQWDRFVTSIEEEDF